jgi:hypothetical protein
VPSCLASVRRSSPTATCRRAVAWQYGPLAAAVGPLVLDGLMVVCGFALVAEARQRWRHCQSSPMTRPDMNKMLRSGGQPRNTVRQSTPARRG